MAPLIQDTLLVPLSSCIEITENKSPVQSFTISYEQNPTHKPYVKFVTKVHVQGSSWLLQKSSWLPYKKKALN